MFTKRNYCVGIIIFVAVWVLILVVPKTRNILRSQIEESKQGQIYDRELETGIRDDQLEKYLISHPDNYTLKILSLERNYGYIPPPGETEFDKIVKDHPQDAWVIKRRLLAYTSEKKLPSNDNFQKRLQFTYPVSESHNYSKNEVAAGLRLAQVGAKLEPENTFFDWMQANFLFADKRPNAALRILKNAAKKQYFDNGDAKTQKGYLTAIHLAGHNLLEEKLMLTPGYIHPRYHDWIQATNGAAVWQGALAEQHGNHQKALDIYSTQLHLCSILRSNLPDTIATNYKVNSLAKLDWLSVKRFPVWIKGFLQIKHRKYSHAEIRRIQNQVKRYDTIVPAKLFSQYALAHNNPQAARTASDLANNLYDDYHKLVQVIAGTANINLYDLLYGHNKIQTIFQLKWVGMQLLLSLFYTLLSAWVILTLFVTFLTKGKKQFHAILDQQINKASIFSALLFISCLYGFLLVFLLNQGITSIYGYQIISSPNESLKLYAQKYFFLTLFVSCFFYCGIAALWKCRKSTFISEAQEAFFAPMSLEYLQKRNQRISLFWQIMFWIILPIIETAWFWWIISGNYSFALIPLPLVIGVIVWWVIKNVTLSQPVLFTGTYWGLFATWLQRSLALLILICTLAYGVTSWASLPLRHEANITLNHVIKVGEVAALREAIQHKPNSSP